MNKKVSVWVLIAVAVGAVIAAPKLRTLPLVNKLPTV